MWLSTSHKKNSKKRNRIEEEEDDQQSILPFPLSFPKFSSANIHSIHNRIYFNDDITTESITALNKELRTLDEKMATISNMFRIDPIPIYLHLTTNGGEIYAAFSAIDCIQQMKCPLYTVVDGFVASAGTLISIAGKKRYILPNAYMLLHELRSGFWGKMSDMTEEMENLKKLMDHLIDYYSTHTPLSKKTLEKLLTKDSIWNAKECISRGVVSEVFTNP